MVSFAAVPAAAGNACVALELTAPEGCPSAAAIEQTVMELVHTLPSTPLAARATIAKQGERYTVTVVTAAGERTLDGETCQAAANALSVILALAVDPHASTTPPASTAPPTPPDIAPAPQPAPPPPAPPVPVAPLPPDTKPETQPAPAPATGAPLTLGAALLLFIDTGILPGVSFGGSGSLRFMAGVVSADLSGKFLLPRTASSEDDPNVGGTFRWAGGELEGCLRVLTPLHTCFGFELGGLTGEGLGVDTPFTSTAMMAALTAGVVYQVEISDGFAIEGRLGVAIPIDRPEFGVEGFGPVHQPDAVSLQGGLGVAFQ